jgi:hypothetical protein
MLWQYGAMVEGFSDHHYVPVMFTKAGERDALKTLADARKDVITPLFTIHPIGWDFDKDAPEKTIDAHLAKLPGDLAQTWGKRPAFLDGVHVENERMDDGSHPIEWMIKEARNEGLELVPVVSPDHSSDYKVAVSRIVTADDASEVCLRLRVSDWPVPPTDSAIDSFLSSIGASRASAHLVLDLRAEAGQAAAFSAENAISAFPGVSDWKTLTLVSTAMPEQAPSGRGVHVVSRHEWTNYLTLVGRQSAGARRPTFGDYVISHPDPFADIDPRVLQISAKLKYTIDDAWLIARGGLFKANGGKSGGGAEIRPVARDLVAHSKFVSGHCAGESWIVDAAATGATGAPRTWVKVGTLHHIQLVADQIART